MPLHMIWIVLIVIVLVAVAVVAMYNKLVRLRNRCENAWAQVDVQLRRRYDLIPNLVETVKGYAAHESQTFEAVTKARANAQAATSPADKAAAEAELTQALVRLNAVAEQYPELKANANFQDLQNQLNETESKIATSRQVYNDTVLTYDNARETLPTSIIAGIFNFEAREYFELELGDAARDPVSVKF
jgi:LemA protein